jgi:hypothetical protein
MTSTAFSPRSHVRGPGRLDMSCEGIACASPGFEIPQQPDMPLSSATATSLTLRRFGLPPELDITLDMPWSSSSPGDQSITQSEPPEYEISGLDRSAEAE